MIHCSCICRAKWIVLDGIEYKNATALVYNMEQDLPKVGVITAIYVVNSSKVLLDVDCFDTMCNSHFHAYELQSLNCSKTCTHH